MSTITTEPTAGQRLVAQIKERHEAHMIDPGWALMGREVGDQGLEVLAFAIDHDLVKPSEITWGLLGNWRALRELLERSGATAEWEADQLSRSVPVVCPSWCDGNHGRPELMGPTYMRLCPGESDSHSGTLAKVGRISIDLVVDTVHPADGQDSAPYLCLWLAGDDCETLRLRDISLAQMEAIAADLATAIAEAKKRFEAAVN